MSKETKHTRNAITALEELLHKQQWDEEDCAKFNKAKDSLCNPKTKEN